LRVAATQRSQFEPLLLAFHAFRDDFDAEFVTERNDRVDDFAIREPVLAVSTDEGTIDLDAVDL